ncbi:MAG: sulfate transporter [Planctomycetes bacterium]|nr:sulfate transporter [Planctomycetota bacterium]
MRYKNRIQISQVGRDAVAGLVVFLIAVPLCLGIALASNAPLFAGLLSGIIGGIVVGSASGSQTSVSGPAAALATIVASEISRLGSYSTFQSAVIIAGCIQLALGSIRAGSIAAFFPSSVIKGLLTAIGILLILKQIPHLLGHDADPTGDMAFQQPDDANTFTELVRMFDHVHPGACLIGFGSLGVLVLWEVIPTLRKSKIPAALVVVAFGMIVGAFLEGRSGVWGIEPGNFVQVPVVEGPLKLASLLQWPDWTAFSTASVYKSGFVLAIAASLGTLLNLESVDKLDKRQRHSPPNRELIAQGIGNTTAGLLGALPMTSEIIRGSINVNAGSRTRLSTIVHGLLLLISVAAFPLVLNRIPLSCLAAILLITGAKLAGPTVIATMWRGGRYQFAPYITTVLAIVFTDLLTGVIVGLFVGLAFILNSNLRRPIQRCVERHLGGDVLHITLSNQVSFLNRAALFRVLDEIPAGSHVLLDAQDTDYIDPDVLSLIRDYCDQIAPARGVRVSLLGFRHKYRLTDQIQYLDYSTRELQDQLTPAQALQILKDGNARFRGGQRLSRDLNRQLRSTAGKQHPFAVILSCIDSRASTELIFDLGLGDAFSIRIAGNVISRKVLASMEYACAVAGAKLIVVMGHTRCGAVTTAVETTLARETSTQLPHCQHLDSIVEELQAAIERVANAPGNSGCDTREERFVTQVAVANVTQTARKILMQSSTLEALHAQGRVAIVGALYDVSTGDIEFMPDEDACISRKSSTNSPA